MSATGDRGFTLVEALVVVAVTAMIGALLFPSIERALGRLAEAQARAALDVELAAARARALRSDAPVRFQIDADGRGFGATGGAHRALAKGVLLSASGPVAFFPDGSATGGVLGLSFAGRPAASVVTIDPVTGLAANQAPGAKR